jgi:hypothetical protein
MPYSTETKAKAIVDAALTTDREAAADHGISRKSLTRWRKDLQTDTALQRLVTERWAEVRAADTWVEDTTQTIRNALSFLRTAMNELDPSDPEAVEAVTGAIQTLAEAKAMADIIDTRIQGWGAGGDVRQPHRRN